MSELHYLNITTRGMPEDDEKKPKRRTLVVASTATPDRYQDIVDQASWKLDRYRANPVVPWGHDYYIPPVGRAVRVEVEGGALIAEIEWDTSEANPLGRLVAEQFASGFLSAVSVGFRPGRSTERKNMPKESPMFGERGMAYFDCELLEISAVAIPANPEALAAKGLPPMRLTHADVRAELVRLLGQDAGVRGVIGDIAEAGPKAREARVMERIFGL
jgi:hypothetical protein